MYLSAIEAQADRPDSPLLLAQHAAEFIAAALQDWLIKVGFKPIQIYPGSPWENGYNERFNGTLRRKS